MTHGLSIIDAEAHVIETERTWDYLDASEQKYRPQLFYSKEDELQQYWVIDGKIRGFRFPTLNEKQLRELSEKTGRRLETPQAPREAARRFQVAGRKFPDNVFEEYKIYVTCQNNDDLPYIVGYSGEGSLLTGTDYRHLDVSTETDAITEFRRQPGISEQTKEKILHHNPKALYGI